ncbi:MAG TPA: Holliday junction resolvase RuvX [Phycisphaerae bacterium]|nr:Holliday junction resolvase RuvX [Phycisphaerae bacterium]HOJ75477.1 Holliday junction resolvase RuvX [Phycisphaerae bacterium]HOM52277.1 Holliday junction resolvase RuvX [Phycisphaerae bacterium]HON66271.1 Holliday junction resolvase RuvX [Phycisphaerae bacterium]HOQ88236.1 Holliday junction resolvase RuvX [Phycisphaerae bacterium]
MRYLGVDFGTKRIGLALADAGEAGGIASPLKILQARPQPAQNAQAILDVADEYGADAIVIGLPLNMDGTEGPQAKLSKSLAAALTQLGSLPVHLHDERLTSHAADHKLLDRDLTRKQKKARHDAVAAAVLLESFLADSQP